MRQRRLYWAILVCCVTGAVLAGCSTHRRTIPVAGNDHPWLNPKEKADAYISTKVRGTQSVKWVEWVNGRGKVFAESLEVMERCQRHLEEQGEWSRLTDVHEGVVMEPRFMEPYYTIGKKTWVHEDVKAIVCIDPVVVVIGPGPIMTNYGPGVDVEGYGETPLHEPKRVFFAHGFIASTRVPYSPEARWFSPDLKEGPKPAERIGPDTRRIDVPWGALILRRQEDQWQVEAVADEEKKRALDNPTDEQEKEPG